MCLQVYLGSSQECAEIPYTDRQDHIFVLKRPQQNGDEGKISLESAYQYRVGVMTCGCGLSYDTPVGQMDEWTRTYHRQLGEYVRECLLKAEPVEFFCSWSGEEHLPVEKQRWITLQDLIAPEFYFEIQQHTVVYKDQTSLQAAKGP